jgi:potassium efflux system protein
MRVLFIILLMLHFFCAVAQKKDSLPDSKKIDSARISFVERIQKAGAAEAVRSIEKWKEGRIAIKQQALMDELSKVNQRIKLHLKRPVDTIAVNRELAKTRAAIEIVDDGVFVNKGSAQTQRNLAVSSAVLSELIIKLSVTKAEVDNYYKTLVAYRDKIDSLYSDSALYFFSSDSLSTIKYYRRIVVIAKDLAPVDTAMNKYLEGIPKIQEKVDMVMNELRTSYEDVERFRDQISSVTLDREFANIWEPSLRTRPFDEIVRFSLAKEKLAIGFYVRDNLFKIGILFLLVMAALFFIRSLKENLNQGDQPGGDYSGQLLFRYPIASALLIVISIFQFAFSDPPFIFSFVLWVISAICLAFIFKNFVTPFWFRFWLVMVVFFLLAGIDNMILQASRSERWFMLVLSLSGVAYGIYVLMHPQKKQLREKKILYFIAIVVFFETASALLNVFGRYNIAKTFLSTGYVGLVIAILFLWTVRLINEGLGHANAVYKHPDKKLFFINFDRVGNKVPGLFYVFLIVGWFIQVGRNFYAFRQMSEPFVEFLREDRVVGSYVFSINGILVFILILFCSLFLSRVISFFAADSEANGAGSNQSKKPGIGSWILLVRIVIISFGLFLAFAASGFPLDKVTIILGALGVGIGLGLQGLVNNLVSGLIIAFEKPVNVGDIIEVDGKTGVMKSIGFRSSVVLTGDGSSIIIPNGDLLSQHLVNWSMGKNKKRINIVVGVAYHTDIEKTLKLLEGILNSTDKIMKNPAPFVFAKDFSQYSIDIEMQFWVSHLKDGSIVKSHVISSVDKVFRENGIVIPLPQQELNLKAVDTNNVNTEILLHGPEDMKK